MEEEQRGEGASQRPLVLHHGGQRSGGGGGGQGGTQRGSSSGGDGTRGALHCTALHCRRLSAPFTGLSTVYRHSTLRTLTSWHARYDASESQTRRSLIAQSDDIDAAATVDTGILRALTIRSFRSAPSRRGKWSGAAGAWRASKVPR